MHIQKRTSKLFGSKKQVEENKANTNPVNNTDKKEVNPANEQTITPYQHPNYKNHFDQRQGQNVHKQRGYNVKCEGTQNLQPKQKTRSFIQQGDQQVAWMKVNLRWITIEQMRQFSSGIWKLYYHVSSSVEVTSSERHGKTLFIIENSFTKQALRTKLPLGGRKCNEHKIYKY